MGNSVLFLVRLLFLRPCPLSGRASVVQLEGSFFLIIQFNPIQNNGVDMGLDAD